MGQIGEWPAWYLHKREHKSYEIIPSKEDKRGYIEKLSHVFPVKSSLHIGEFGAWSVDLAKEEDGDFNFWQHGKINEGFENNKPDALVLLEGSALDVEQTEYERNPVARKKCIEHYGAGCQACGFHFGQIYGTIGDGFIHVHHIKPISMQGGQYEVNPITDLIPLCPNCHAMAHRRNPPYTIKELKSLRKKY